MRGATGLHSLTPLSRHALEAFHQTLYELCLACPPPFHHFAGAGRAHPHPCQGRHRPQAPAHRPCSPPGRHRLPCWEGPQGWRQLELAPASSLDPLYQHQGNFSSCWQAGIVFPHAAPPPAALFLQAHRSPFPYSTSAALLFPDSTLLLNGPSAHCAALPFPDRITRDLECFDCSLDPHLPLSHSLLNLCHVTAAMPLRSLKRTGRKRLSPETVPDC